jgi:hypothetical protein
MPEIDYRHIENLSYLARRICIALSGSSSQEVVTPVGARDRILIDRRRSNEDDSGLMDFHELMIDDILEVLFVSFERNVLTVQALG